MSFSPGSGGVQLGFAQSNHEARIQKILMTRVLSAALPLALVLTASAAQAMPSSQLSDVQTQAFERPEDTAGTVWDVRPF